MPTSVQLEMAKLRSRHPHSYHIMCIQLSLQLPMNGKKRANATHCVKLSVIRPSYVMPLRPHVMLQQRHFEKQDDVRCHPHNLRLLLEPPA